VLRTQTCEVERRDRDVHVPAFEQLRHVAVQERQDECPDVRAVDVCVRHDDDAVVAKLRDVELLADAGANHLDEQLHLGVREDLVDSVLLGVDDLAAQRQDRLVRLVARILRGAAGRVALDDEHLGELRVAHLAIRELLCNLAAESALAPCQVARLARRLPGIP
jgi:predicted RecB family endonuclease